MGVKVGLKEQITKPEERRKRRAILDELGVNTEAHLVKAINPVETFQQRFNWWKENKLIDFKPSSCNMPCIIRKHMIPVFGSLSLDAIDEKRVQEWVSALHKDGKLRPKSVQNVWKVLRLVLGKKHTSGWTIVLPRNPKKQQRYLTAE